MLRLGKASYWPLLLAIRQGAWRRPRPAPTAEPARIITAIAIQARLDKTATAKRFKTQLQRLWQCQCPRRPLNASVNAPGLGGRARPSAGPADPHGPPRPPPTSRASGSGAPHPRSEA